MESITGPNPSPSDTDGVDKSNLKLLFKRGKKEGLEKQHYSIITPSTAICRPSHSQELNPQYQQEQGEEEEQQSVDPTLQSDAFDPPPPDPDHKLVPNQPEEEEEAAEDQDGQEKSSDVAVSSAFPAPPSLCGPNGSDLVMTSSSYQPPNKRGIKRKKVNNKKQQAIEKKVQALLEKLVPVPFIPSKILDFSKHEKLLRRLYLWDFVHIEFDRDNIRVDLIAQLVANYDSKSKPKHSFVNGVKIRVNRADLARALKLPVKKDTSCNVVVDGVDLDNEALSEDSISFIEDFVSNWVLLHEDTWMMPVEVLNWTKAIKDGHPEKVDWAGLFWFMIEKELMKGEQLTDCYYASHLQYLIKSQREEVLTMGAEEVVLRDEPEKVDLGEDSGKVVLDEEVKEEDGIANEGNVKTGGEIEVPEKEDGKLPGPNVELTLGQDAQEEEMKDAEMVDFEESKEDGEEQEQDQSQWLQYGKNNAGHHYMQRCSMEEDRGLGSLNEGKREDDQLNVEDAEGEGEEDGFDVVPGEYADGGEGLTGNFLQAMETNQIAFGSQGQLHDQCSVDLLESRNELQHMSTGGPSFYIHKEKREIDHEHEIAHHSLNGSNKRLRIDGQWADRPLDFGTCMDQMQHLIGSARMMYEEKKQVLEDSNLQKQIMVNEVQKRDAVIEHLHKTKCEEIQKREVDIFRLQRELFLMGNLVEEYRDALKESDRAFAEYRQQYQIAEEPIYEDAGPGGIMLTTAEIEKQRLEQEEYRKNCLLLEQKAKETEDGIVAQFGDYLDKVKCLEKRLAVVESTFKVLRDSRTKSKVSEMEEKISEASEYPGQ